MRWLAGLALIIVAGQAATGTGHVTGFVTDTAGGLIPGTTITLRSGERERTAVTDAQGAFSFSDVPPGRYAVVASLHGFYGQPHTDVIVTAGGTVYLKFELLTDCLAHVDYVDMGLPWTLREADLVAHIRVARPDAACAMSSVCSCTLHSASVLSVLKGQPLSEIRMLQEGAGFSSTERPYAAGDEFIAFLKRDNTNHAFARIAGPLYMLRVRDGRVHFGGRPPPAGLKEGMTISEFANALRATR